MNLLSGRVGSAEQERQYASYYGRIARARPETGTGVATRYELREEVGRGSIQVAPLHGALRLVTYDVEFSRDHRVGFDFDSDRFELEFCVDGAVRIAEQRSGSAELGRSTSSLTSLRATRGVLTHPAGQRYRAVSLTGDREALAGYLGSANTADVLAALDAIGRSDPSGRADPYLGRAAQPRGLADLMTEMFTQATETAADRLRLGARVMSVLALLLDSGTRHDGIDGFADHEIEALRRVPALLWAERHDPPTLEQVARRSSMSVKRLSAGFTALFGTTPVEHHRRYCLERAKAMLCETDWTVERIGFEIGYSSASNFVSAFRRRQGDTPAEFRRFRARAAAAG